MLISFLFLNENICCGCSLEAPRRGASNEYPQHMFSSRNKKNIMWIPSLICSYETVQIQISWLLHKPTYLDLDFLQRQSKSGFSRTRVNAWSTAFDSFFIVTVSQLNLKENHLPLQLVPTKYDAFVQLVRSSLKKNQVYVIPR